MPLMNDIIVKDATVYSNMKYIALVRSKSWSNPGNSPVQYYTNPRKSLIVFNLTGGKFIPLYTNKTDAFGGLVLVKPTHLVD